MFTMALGEGLFLPLAPLYMEELGAGPEQIGLLVALFAAAQMVAMIPAGLASDRWGPRPLLLGGWVAAVLAAAIMALAPGLGHYAVGYAGYGLTFGVIPPISTAITRGRGGWTPERAFTRVYSFFGTGLIISPILGGLIGEAYGLRTNYYLALVLILISTGIISRIGSMRSQSAQDRLSPVTLIRRRSYLLFLGIVFAVAFAGWLGMPLAPNYLQNRWGISVSSVGFLSSIASVGSVAMALYLGRKGPRRVLILLQAAVVIYLVIMLRTGQIGWLILAYFVRSGAMLSRRFLDAISARIVEPSQLGLAFALNSFASRAAEMGASALAGYLFAAGPSLPFQLGLWLIPLSAALIWWKLPGARDDEKLAGTPVVITAETTGSDRAP